MALIGEIRKKKWLLLVVIVIGMLAFIFGGGGGNGSQERVDSIISNVNGEGITSSQYQILVDNEYKKFARVYQNLYQQPVPAGLKSQLDQGFLSQYLSEQLYKKQFDAIGLIVNDEEFNEIIQGENVDPKLYEQNRIFVNANGQFDIDSLRKQLPLYSQNPEFSFFLENIIGKQAEKERLISKYNTMISKGLYVTSKEAEKSFVDQNKKVSFDYVYKSFSSIPDSAVNISESDIKTYYDKHKNEKKYEQNDAVSFQYVEFPIVPSAFDKKLAYESLSDTTFINMWKNDDNDSSYVINRSETKDLNFVFKTADKFPSEIDSKIQAANKGDVIGPYLDGDFYKLSKVLAVESQKEAKVRHILIGKDDLQRGSMRYGSNMTRIKQIADSVIRVIKANNNFEAMLQMSTDVASVPNGGLYDWFGEDMGFVQPFKDAAFTNPINSVRAVETQFGIHIMEVLGRRNGKKLKVATIDTEIRATTETINLAKDKAIDFLNVLDKANVADTTFVNAARKNGLFIKPANDITLSQKSIPGIDDNLIQIQKWAFAKNIESGDLSEEIVLNKKILVAQLQKRTFEGVPDFEAVKQEMSFEVIKQKKGETYTSKMGGSSLEEIATTIGSSVQNATELSLSQVNIQGAGYEPAVVGGAFSNALNTVSKPIIGKSGVFVVVTKTITEAVLPKDYKNEQYSTTLGLRGRVQSEVFQALYDAADVKDNRDKINIIGQ